MGHIGALLLAGALGMASGLAIGAVRVETLSIAKDVLSTDARDSVVYAVGREGKRTAYVARRGSRITVVVDGRDGPLFDSLAVGISPVRQLPAGELIALGGTGKRETTTGLLFTDDESKLVYIATREGKQNLVIVDDQSARVSPPYNRITYVQLAPRGKGVAAVVDVDDKIRGQVWVDGLGLQDLTIGDPNSLRFSEDGRHLGYLGQRERKAGVDPATPLHHVWLDGVVGPGIMMFAGEQRLLHLHYEGKPAVAFGARQREDKVSSRLYLQDASGRLIPGPLEMVYGTLLATPSGHYVYVAAGSSAKASAQSFVQGEAVVILDGKEVGRHKSADQKSPMVKVEHLSLSADASRLAYVVHAPLQEGGQPRSRVVLDGKLGRSYDWIQSLHLSPDGKRLAYVANAANGMFVVEGETEYGPFTGAEGVRFSADGRHLTFVGAEKDGDKLFFDGNVIEETMNVDPRWVHFLPDGSGLAYVAQTVREQIVVVGKGRSPGHDFYDGPVFSKDFGRWVAFTGSTGVNGVLVDGKPVAFSQQVDFGSREVLPDALAVSPDGRHALFTASVRENPGSSPARVVFVNGKPQLDLSWWGPLHALNYNKNANWTFVALRAGKLVRVSIDPATDSSKPTIGDRPLAGAPWPELPLYSPQSNSGKDSAGTPVHPSESLPPAPTQATRTDAPAEATNEPAVKANQNSATTPNAIPAQPSGQTQAPASTGNATVSPQAPAGASLPAPTGNDSAADAQRRAQAIQELSQAHAKAMREASQAFQAKIRSAKTPQERRALQDEYRQVQQQRQQEFKKKLGELR